MSFPQKHSQYILSQGNVTGDNYYFGSFVAISDHLACHRIFRLPTQLRFFFDCNSPINISKSSHRDNDNIKWFNLSLISIESNKNCAAAILLSLRTSSQYFLTIWLILNEGPNTSHNLNPYRSQQNCKFVPSRDGPHSNNTLCRAIKSD